MIPKVLAVLILILFSAVVILYGQNLAPNSDFETYTACPTTIAEVSQVSPWIRPTTGTSDYFNACWTSGAVNVSVPNNFVGSQAAYSGNAYMGLISYSAPSGTPNNYREYLQVALSSPLTAGTNYNVELYYTLADNSQYSSDGLGFYFSTTAISSGTSAPLTAYTPQVSNPSGSLLSSKTTWKKVSGSFVASGGEQYLTIGNFNNDAGTVTGSVAGTIEIAYFYIDAVSVTPSALPVEMISFSCTSINGKNSLQWSTASEQNNALYTIESSSDGLYFVPIGKVPGAGTVSHLVNYSFNDLRPLSNINYYRLRQQDYNGNYNLSKVITQENSASEVLPETPSILIKENKIYISNTGKETAYITVKLIDLSGRVVYNEHFAVEKSIAVPISSALSGLYILNVNNSYNCCNYKIMLSGK